MKKLIAMMLALVMVLSLAACGKKEEAPAPAPEQEKTMTYAVEAGSAGEAVALENGFEVVSVDTQAKALMEVQAGTSDACVIDLLMAGAMIGEGTDYEELAYTVELTSEEYGVGFRTDSDLVAEINAFFAAAYEDGSMLETAKVYGVQESIVEQAA